jgi:hypothetical protein
LVLIVVLLLLLLLLDRGIDGIGRGIGLHDNPGAGRDLQQVLVLVETVMKVMVVASSSSSAHVMVQEMVSVVHGGTALQGVHGRRTVLYVRLD